MIPGLLFAIPDCTPHIRRWPLWTADLRPTPGRQDTRGMRNTRWEFFAADRTAAEDYATRKGGEEGYDVISVQLAAVPGPRVSS